MSTPFDPRDVLTRPLMAYLATQSDDGPRIAPVWFLCEDDALWMLGATTSGSVMRIAADPRVAVEICHFDTAAGILLHLGLRGRADVLAMQPDRFRRLLDRYLGEDRDTWNPWFLDHIARIDDPDGRLIRLVPESTFTNNVSYFHTGPDLAWP
jgi:general stress protein 26